MERLYLDTCVWCRPFDEPTPRITKEAEALHRILSMVDEAEIEIVGSGIVLFEAYLVQDPGKRDAALDLIHKSITVFAEASDEIGGLAADLVGKCGLDAMDAAHIATAIDSGADVFVTTDDEILDKGDCVSEFGVIVKNPVDYRLVRG